MSYTAAQRRGVTDTSEGVDDGGGVETPGEQVSVEKAAYGEIEAVLPGKGVAAVDCGEYQPMQFCDEGNHVHFGEHLCGRRECPRCWSGQWAGPRTASVVSRLAAGRWANDDGIDRRLVHATVSPPEGEVESVSPMFRNRKKAVEIVRGEEDEEDEEDEGGVRGGVVVVHPYRATDEAKRRFRESEFERLWRFVRENDRHWYGQVRWSPHYHVIGLCRDFEAAEKREDGWVVKNHSTGYGVEPNPSVDRRFSPFESLADPEPYEDMIGVVRYLLSHTAVVSDRQAVTWFGSLHSTNFCPDPSEVEDRETDPELGPLSPGAWRTIQRKSEELTGFGDDRSEEGGGDGEEKEECPVEECGGYLHPIWDVPGYIDQCGDDLSREALTRLGKAYSWAVGDVEEMPPGGWPSPRSEEQAVEEFEGLLGGYEI